MLIVLFRCSILGVPRCLSQQVRTLYRYLPSLCSNVIDCENSSKEFLWRSNRDNR